MRKRRISGGTKNNDGRSFAKYRRTSKPRARGMETQETISAWQRATFGRVGDPAKLIARAGEEFLELIGEVLPAEHRDILEGIRSAWAHEAVTPTREESPYYLTRIQSEMADVLIVLYGAAEAYGFNLQEVVDSKMRINRARTWKQSGNGFGQHI